MSNAIRMASLLCLMVFSGVSGAQLESVFSVQGELRDESGPANGSYDIEAELHNTATGGTPIATDILTGVNVVSGLFSIELDFTNAPFEVDEQYWVEIAVRPASSGAFVALAPRTKLTASPFALGAVTVVPGAIGSAEIDPSEVQARVGGTCPAGQSIRTIALNGTVVCEVDNDTLYSGANFALSNQACPGGQVARAIDRRGNVVCTNDDDSTYSGVDFALSDEQCQPGAFVTGIDESGFPVCEAPPGTAVAPRPSYAFGFYDQGSDNIGHGLSMVIGADGLPVMSHVDITNGNLLVTHCEDLVCSGSTTSIVDSGLGATATGDAYTSIAIGVDGLPIIGYYDTDDQSLKAAICNDLACSGQDETIRTIDSTNVVGQYVSIGISANSGAVVFAYHDASLLDLKWAVCSSSTCSSLSVVGAIDSDGDVGRHASLAMDGVHALISYYDGTNGDLKYVVCDTRFGTSCSAPRVVASAGDVGLESFIFFDFARSKPYIAYLDAASKTFVAACFNVSCVGATISPTNTFFDFAPPKGVLTTTGLPLLVNVNGVVPDVWICGDADCTDGDRDQLPVAIPQSSSKDVAITIDPFGYPLIAVGKQGFGLEFVRCGTRNCEQP